MNTQLSFTKMDEADAGEILAWRYQAPYDFYNANEVNLTADIATLLEPKNYYFAVRDAKDSLLCYYCFANDARVVGGDYDDNAVDIGGGAKPELTGTGFGANFIKMAMTIAQQLFQARKVRATVAAFNTRALKMCEKAAFVRTQQFTRDDGVEFVVLVKEF